MADFIEFEAVVLAGTLLSLVVGTVVHEFGHALGAAAVGLPPRLISIGQGPYLTRLRLGGAWLVLRAAPVGGYIHTPIGPDTTAQSRFIMTAAGPAATGLMLAAAIAVARFAPLSDLAKVFWEGGVLGQAVILANTAIPYERKLKTHVSTSDGLKLIRLARGENRGAFDRLHAALIRRHLPEGAPAPAPSRHFPEIAFQLARRDRRTDAWAQAEVTASMRGLLAQNDLPDGERAIAVELLELCDLYDDIRADKAELKALVRQRR